MTCVSVLQTHNTANLRSVGLIYVLLDFILEYIAEK